MQEDASRIRKEKDMKPIKITKYGMTVHCYGKWERDSNASCVFEDEWLDDIWVGDERYPDGPSSWNQVVEVLAEYAQRNGTTLIEMVAC